MQSICEGCKEIKQVLHWICNACAHGRQGTVELREKLGIRGMDCSVQKR